MTIVRDVQQVEVHRGADGINPTTTAKHWVEKNIEGATVIEVRSAGIRCAHGHPVWDVEFEVET